MGRPGFALDKNNSEPRDSMIDCHALTGRAGLRALIVAGCALAAAPGLAQAPDAAPAPATVAPVSAPPERFEINAFDVIGVRTLDAAAVEAAIYPFAGPGRSVADVEAARAALEAAYKSRGFESVLVETPPQQQAAFIAGIVQLRVTEAPIGRLTVTGSKYVAPSVVAAQIPALREGGVPNLQTAQAQLTEANRLPDRTITPSIRAGRIPGTIDVELRVDDTLPFHAGVELNNDHSSTTSDLRLGFNARYTNLWQAGHTLQGGYLVSIENREETEVISASYVAPFAGTPWTLLAFGYKSNSDIGSLGGTRVLGDGYALGLRAIYRLPSTTVAQTVSFGVDYKDFKEDIAVPAADPDDPPALLRSPIQYVPLVLGYTAGWVTERNAANLTLGLTAALRQLGDDSAILRARRGDAIGNFVRLNLDADYSRSFARDIVGFARFSGQLSDSPLVTNEQFAIGGNTNVRGYFQSEAIGDDGVSGALELRSPSFAGSLGKYVDEVRIFVFADGGYVRVRSPLAEQIDNFTLASIGAGARFQVLRYLRGEVAYGYALRDGTATDSGDGTVLFSVKAEF